MLLLILVLLTGSDLAPCSGLLLGTDLALGSGVAHILVLIWVLVLF